MIIDGKDLILGKLAAFAAKRALEGEQVEIVNSEAVVVSGSRKDIISRFKRKRARGNPHHGPFFPRREDMIVKRVIRGMLPHKKGRGRSALNRVKCYRGVPSGMKGKKLESVEMAHVKNLSTMKYMAVGEISRLLGAE